MGAARKLIGWVWLVGPLLVLAVDIWDSTDHEFISLSYYVVVWGVLLAMALAGFWFLIGGLGARWAVIAAAVVSALYTVWLFLIAYGNAPFFGGHDYLMYGLMGAAVLFCISSVALASKHAT